MRKYFFRGYHKRENRWLAPAELANMKIQFSFEGFLTWPDDIVLLPFTGKADNQGKPLFEGDIVDFDQYQFVDESMPDLVTRKRGVMKWIDNPGMYTAVIKGDKSLSGLQYRAENVCRVGSVIDEPKLLSESPKEATL